MIMVVVEVETILKVGGMLDQHRIQLYSSVPSIVLSMLEVF